MLRRQLSKWPYRTAQLCEQSNQKAQEAKAKMHELRAIHPKLTEEHAEKGKEMERLDILGGQREKTSISCRGSTQRRKGEVMQQG
ncbi:putative kinetochore protein NUF2 [Metarhizium anisopliae]|nr:putative kinetochore protein NUF2 [Metarhizium anisopliae]